jgi:hypothetical protein
VLDALLSLRFVPSAIALSQNMLALPILERFNPSQTLRFTIRLSRVEASKMYKAAHLAANTPFFSSISYTAIPID